ncbi:unnamed protein product [Arctogadus glacialis]
MDTCIPLLQAKHQNATTRQGESGKPSQNTGRWIKKPPPHRRETGSERDGDKERRRERGKRADGSDPCSGLPVS